jgi:hypothetical protein
MSFPLIGRVFFAAVLFATVTTASAAADHRVVVVNQSGLTIVEFYSQTQAAPGWNKDILGYEMLPSGGSLAISLEDESGGCIYDFKVVFSNGDAVTEYGNNICETETLVFN